MRNLPLFFFCDERKVDIPMGISPIGLLSLGYHVYGLESLIYDGRRWQTTDFNIMTLWWRREMTSNDRCGKIRSREEDGLDATAADPRTERGCGGGRVAGCGRVWGCESVRSWGFDGGR